MHAITKTLCSLQKKEMWYKCRFSSCKKAVEPKLRQGHCDQGCSWLQGRFSSGPPPQTSIPFPSPCPITLGRLLVGWWRLLLGTWSPGQWGPGAQSITLWPKSPHWQAFSSRWEVGPLELDMAGLSVPDNKLCLVRRAFMGSVMLLSRAMLTFPQVSFWLLQTGNGVEKSTQAERAPLAGDFSHLITWFSFPAVRKKMELHHAPCSLGKGPIVSNRAAGDRHNTCAPCFMSDIRSSKQVWVLLLGGSSIGNKGDQASPVSLPAPPKKKIFI